MSSRGWMRPMTYVKTHQLQGCARAFDLWAMAALCFQGGEANFAKGCSRTRGLQKTEGASRAEARAQHSAGMLPVGMGKGCTLMGGRTSKIHCTCKVIAHLALNAPCFLLRGTQVACGPFYMYGGAPD